MKAIFQFKSLPSGFSFLFVLATLSFSCEHLDRLPEPNRPRGKEIIRVHYGPATGVGQGFAMAWVATDKKGIPLSVGVKMSERAVQSLMEETENVHEGAHQAFTLRLPKQAETTLYEHLILDWNPHGHPAPGIYDLPHFDLHAYMISEEQRLALPPMAPFDDHGQPQFDESPAPEFIPEGYFLEPGVVPAMGAHWLDEDAHEFHGETFTRTFIYGSFQGEFTFHEPMFTVAYLNDLKQRAQPYETINIKQPLSYQKEGYYPTKYSFTYQSVPGVYIISMDELVYRSQTLP